MTSNICAICCDNMDKTNTLYLLPDKLDQIIFCIECIEYMINNNFSRYIQNIANADCEKSLKSSLIDHIPLYITKDCLKKSEQIIQLYLSDDHIIDCKLVKPINDTILEELNKELDNIKNQMDLDNSFDYLGSIQKLLKDYGLDNLL